MGKRDQVLACLLLCQLMLVEPRALAGTYTVGVESIDYFPHYAVRDGRYIGYARDLLDQFGRIYGHQFVYVMLPVRRLGVAFLKQHNLDFKFPDNPNWATDLRANQKLFYSETVIDVTEGALVLAERKGRASGEVQVLGTVMGFTPWPYRERIDQGLIRVSENPSFEALIRQVLLRRVDAAYVNVEVADEILRTKFHRPGALVFDPDLPHATSGFRLSTFQYPGVVRQFNEFLNKEKALQSKLCTKYRMKCGEPH